MDAETKAYLDDMKADIDRQFGQLMEAVQALAIGTGRRFDSIEKRLDRNSPRGSEGWKPQVL